MANGAAMASLTADMAGALRGAVAGDAALRGRLVDAVVSNDASRRKLIQALVKSLG